MCSRRPRTRSKTLQETVRSAGTLDGAFSLILVTVRSAGTLDGAFTLILVTVRSAWTLDGAFSLILHSSSANRRLRKKIVN